MVITNLRLWLFPLVSAIYFRIPSLFLFGCGTEIDKVDNAHIGDASVRLQSDFTSTTIGVAYFNMIGFDLWTELAQTILVEFWESKSPIASEATATHALRQEDIRRTQFS